MRISRDALVTTATDLRISRDVFVSRDDLSCPSPPPGRHAYRGTISPLLLCQARLDAARCAHIKGRLGDNRNAYFGTIPIFHPPTGGAYLGTIAPLLPALSGNGVWRILRDVWATTAETTCAYLGTIRLESHEIDIIPALKGGDCRAVRSRSPRIPRDDPARPALMRMRAEADLAGLGGDYAYQGTLGNGRNAWLGTISSTPGPGAP